MTVDITDDTVDILRCQSNNYQIISGLYQHNNTLTIDFFLNWTYKHNKHVSQTHKDMQHNLNNDLGKI
jgi:hypothetical protein